jgi:hypothetical protein
MSITAIPAAAGTIAGDFAAAGRFLEDRDRQPDRVVVNVRVNGDTRAEKLADLKRIADDWGVRIGTDGHGTAIAERHFGLVRVEAHVSAEDVARRTLARIDAAKAVA